MHVVAEESGGAPLQTARAPREFVGVRLDFGDVVLRPDRYGTQRPRMRVGCALVVHRHVEEPRGGEGFTRRLDLLQMAAEGFLTLVETEHGLERRRQSIAQPLPDIRERTAVSDPSRRMSEG